MKKYSILLILLGFLLQSNKAINDIGKTTYVWVLKADSLNPVIPSNYIKFLGNPQYLCQTDLGIVCYIVAEDNSPVNSYPKITPLLQYEIQNPSNAYIDVKFKSDPF